MPTRRTLLLRGLAVAIAGAAVPAALQAMPQHGHAPVAGLGGALDLVDHHGAPFNLQRLAGRPSLVFFGLTRCGTTCPIALAVARQVLDAFGAQAAPPIVFVTLDPLNDGPRELKTHLGRIDARLIGLTGTPPQVADAAERFGVGTRVRADGVDHSSMWYLLDERGRVSRVYAYTTPSAHLVDDLRRLAAH
ncbi:SCO family protein [Aquincola sp. S2]|uniref:SCO family protein n=1 Tax=Pseudaquabacterium terrae TaxID=2732868 RepID=A0ABX2EQ05_9BURK|nr:SCO family protein [Aquabacterium terrae]NRF70678.1 SCO family protein [Aquabacterium terrae]